MIDIYLFEATSIKREPFVRTIDICNLQFTMDLIRLERSASIATEAMYTIALQHKRANSTEQGDNEFVMRIYVDLQFFVLALNRLFNAVRMLVEEADVAMQINDSLDKFSIALPNFRVWRNIIEHMDEYIVGKGNNRKYAKDGVQSMSFDGKIFEWYEDMDIDVALASSETLYGEFLTIIKPYKLPEFQ